MVEKALEYIKEQNLNIYDIAVMTGSGIEYIRCQPYNVCNAGYSVTKLFIVTMIGILYDHGLIRLDDRITDVLAESLDFEYDSIWNQVTVHHALTHSMGIDYGVIDIDRDDTSQYNYKNYLEYIFSYPPVKTPGLYRSYTDIPHYLLSLVIEKVTGKRADEIITEMILNPMQFASSAWARCPLNHTIGASGSYMSARDMVKLAWLYQNYGEFQGMQIISREWAELTEKEQYDLYPLEGSAFWGKGGMNGQMTMFNRKEEISVAWHGYEPEQKDLMLISWFDAQRF